MNIVIDTREQKPYGFHKWSSEVTVVFDTLAVGDYSLLEWSDHVAVERKSIVDFFSSIGRDHERFYREMEKLSCMRWKMLVVEATMIDCLEARRSHQWTRLVESQVWGNITVLLADLQIPIVFAESRNVGEETVMRFLRRVQTKLHHYDQLPIMPVLYRNTHFKCSCCGKSRQEAIKERPDLGVREWVRVAEKRDGFGTVMCNNIAVCYACREKINRKRAKLPEGYSWQR